MTIETERRNFIQGAGLLAAAASTAVLAVGPALAQASPAPGTSKMPYQAKPMPFDPKAINGISEKVLVSHYQNNYVGAVNRLNAIGAELDAEMEHQTVRDTTTGRPKPMGARGARMADTVGSAQN